VLLSPAFKICEEDLAIKSSHESCAMASFKKQKNGNKLKPIALAMRMTNVPQFLDFKLRVREASKQKAEWSLRPS
jgi:hypothetical protein